MDKEQIEHMVTQFLGWKLPEDFYPDCHVSFDSRSASEWPHSWPIGTNLFNADQVKAMVAHMLEGLPESKSNTTPYAYDVLLPNYGHYLTFVIPKDGEDHVALYDRPASQYDAIKQAMDKMSDRERLDLIHEYCQGCGSTDLRCQCWNDE